MYTLSVVLFRRDLRVNDNTALLEAAKQSEQLLAVFCLNPKQLLNNPYRGEHSVQFMQDSLQDLDRQLNKYAGFLQLVESEPAALVPHLKALNVKAIFANKDYTPFAIKRDQQLAAACKSAEIDLHLFDDYLLHAPDIVKKPDGKPYTVYTPFYKRASQSEVALPRKIEQINFSDLKLPQIIAAADLQLVKNYQPEVLKGGRSQALNVLAKLADYKNYKENRDIPALDFTTKLSSHLKFGTISARELYHLTAKYHGSEHTLIRELYWRDFFTQVAFHFPHVFEKSFNPKYENIIWDEDQEKFTAWCNGLTGFPIVDAGMRELNRTGYMHNRVRMITASFLIKDLHINWQWGEKYFAQQLCDYDPAVNNGNWQWASSTGCDAAPYFRIFNPWLQQKKFDPDAIYIKRWIPELSNSTAADIHAWEIKQQNCGYPAPIIDHQSEKMETLQRYSTD